MNAIQVLLVAAAFLWLASYLSRVRTLGLTRILAVVAALGGVVLVLFPTLSTRIAGLFGVTRGVDLVIYVSLVAFGFLWLQLAVRMRGLEDRLVELARQVALDRAGATAGAAQEVASAPPEAPSTRS
jgi:hypothetical protein